MEGRAWLASSRGGSDYYGQPCMISHVQRAEAALLMIISRETRGHADVNATIYDDIIVISTSPQDMLVHRRTPNINASKWLFPSSSIMPQSSYVFP